MELIGGGSVINGATPSSLLCFRNSIIQLSFPRPIITGSCYDIKYNFTRCWKIEEKKQSKRTIIQKTCYKQENRQKQTILKHKNGLVTFDISLCFGFKDNLIWGEKKYCQCNAAYFLLAHMHIFLNLQLCNPKYIDQLCFGL